jgi:hypothetical protein
MIQTKTKTKTVVKKPAKTYPILSEEGDLADALNETARMRAAGKVPKAKDAMKQVDKWNKEGKLSPKKMGGKVVKKAKNGTSLGMKSVKAGYDNNSGVTRADFVSIGKGKAKSGAKVKKAMMGSSMMAAPMMKKGGSMKKCKYGCK